MQQFTIKLIKPNPVTQSLPAAIYMFTSDSPFNAEMNSYMVDGAIIDPPAQPSLSLNFNLSSDLDLETFNTTAGAETVFLVDDSVQ